MVKKGIKFHFSYSKINLVIAPNIRKTSANYLRHTVSISKKETVKDLREKIQRIFKQETKLADGVSLNQIRFWKLDPKEDWKNLIESSNKATQKVIINGKKLNDTIVLEVIIEIFITNIGC